MNEQNQNTQPVVQTNKRPGWVTIIAILLIIYSIFSFSLSIGMLAMSAGDSSEIWEFWMVTLLLFGLPVFVFITSIGLLMMRKWSLYCLIIVGLIPVLPPFINMFNIETRLILYVLIIPTFIYLWKIRKQFN